MSLERGLKHAVAMSAFVAMYSLAIPCAIWAAEGRGHWLMQTAALMLFAAMYSLVGLIAVWGAQGRGHWFLRMVVVLTFPALWLLTSDRRLCLFFLSEMAVVVFALWHLRSRHEITKRTDEGPSSDADLGSATSGPQANKRRRRYSLAELLLAFVLLSGVLAMLVRLPLQVRWDWYEEVLPGGAIGVFILIAVWAAQSRRSVYLRAAALAVAFPALLVGVWLWLNRSVRGPIGRAAAGLSLLLLAAAPTRFYYVATETSWLAYPPPLADNGYVDLLSAAEKVFNATVDVDTLSGDELRDYLTEHEAALQLARRALARPCQAVLYVRMDDARLLAECARLRKLSRAFAAQGRIALQEGQVEDAVESYLDAIELGAAIANGGVLWHNGNGLDFEQSGIEGLQKLVCSLDEGACRNLVERLAEIDSRREPLENCLAREHLYYACEHPWAHRFNAFFRVAYPSQPFGDDRWSVGWDREKRARLLLLIAHLALRRYWLARRKYPDSLEELVPRYLAAVPSDPFADRALTYKKRPASYLLYSTGEDHVDDSGSPAATFLWPHVLIGDIVVPVDLPPAVAASPD